ncbi:MAG: hypothetical protein KF830_01270 [Planctomycetes bacterium]|nr:hypothetical protein [Planctomycetota bacterium]
MARFAAILLASLAATGLLAQERPATVTLDDGRVLTGTVVGIDLGSLQLRVDGEVVVLRTPDIVNCRFDDDEPPPAAVAAEPAAPLGETAASEPPAPRPAPPAKRRGPRPAPVAASDPAAVPHDLRHRSRLWQRLQAVDEAYPWLVPTSPAQWISGGLFLLAWLSLVVHLSVRVVGAEAPAFGASMAMAAWYGVTGLLQAALVPSLHVATFAMLIGNPALAVFGLRQLFGLGRGGAALALAVQAGCLALGFGVLELIDALLAAVAPPPA